MTLFFALGILLIGAPALADYDFNVEKNHVDTHIGYTGTIGIHYELTFRCNSRGDAIDIVDIGLPNSYYDLSSASADLDGLALTDIRHSEYVKPGVEVHLGGAKIRPGSSGTLTFYIETRNLIFRDTEDDSYASFKFSPTWFSSQFARGTTDLAVSIHFPPGVQPDETKWHRREFDSHARDDDGNIVFTWHDPAASPSAQYTYGVSFPKKYVASGAIGKAAPRRNVGRAIERSIPAVFGFFVMIVVFGGIVAAALSQKKRLMHYLPPSLSIEGVGVKRGLMAVEAAVLLERPLDKVCTMILFGLLKKEVLKVSKLKPLRLEVTDGDREGLQAYESGFIGAIDKKGRVSEEKLRRVLIALIKSTNEKMKGFSRRETKEYYESIVNKAWGQVSQSDAPDVASEVIDRELEWLLVDSAYDKRMSEAVGGRTVFIPAWFPGYSTAARTDLPHISVPSLPGSEFANSVVKSVEGFANGLVSKVESFTAGITKTTNPPASGSWSGSGGSGCACACACAGCACACAGGGR
jgi:hypothetical protein